MARKKASAPQVRKPRAAAARKSARAGGHRRTTTLSSRSAERIAELTRAQTVPADATALLAQDHREAESLFAQFRAAGDPDAQQRLAQQICLALTVHTTLEEGAFYPAARKVLAEASGGEDLLDEAEVEHASAKTLIAEIQAMTPRDPLFAAKVNVLGEYVQHHVREEETQLFPKLRDGRVDLYDVGADLAERKVALLLTYRPMANLPSAGRRRTGSRRSKRR